MATDRVTTYGVLGTTLRVLGAASLLSVGAIHLQQYDKLYSDVPTIGTLFVLSFVGATLTAIALLMPLEHLLGRLGFGRLGELAVVVLALLGIGQAAMQFVFLAISEQRPLFGFQEPGYDPTAILAARAAEIATVVFLCAFLIIVWVRRSRRVSEGRSVQSRPARHANLGGA